MCIVNVYMHNYNNKRYNYDMYNNPTNIMMWPCSIEQVSVFRRSLNASFQIMLQCIELNIMYYNANLRNKLI